MSRIRVLRSYTAGKRPSAVQCPSGMLFVNFADKVISTKDGGGVSVDIADNGAAPFSMLTTQKFTATASQTTFAASITTSGNQIVYQNGKRLSQSAYSVTSGNVVLNTGATAGDTIVVLNMPRNAFYSHQEYTAAGAAPVLTFTAGYRVNSVQVFINGLRTTHFTATNGSTVTVTGALAGDSVVITTMNASK